MWEEVEGLAHGQFAPESGHHKLLERCPLMTQSGSASLPTSRTAANAIETAIGCEP